VIDAISIKIPEAKEKRRISTSDKCQELRPFYSFFARREKFWHSPDITQKKSAYK
jgi:hypothetical protein